MNNYFSEQLEFKNNSEKDTNFSVFSASCKHPSSFHHKDLRNIRMNIYKDFIGKFKLYFPQMKFRMLFDCLCCITKKSKYTQCNFSDDFRKDDLVFRGFVNLNESGNQHFHFKRIDKKGDETILKEIIFPKHVVLYNTKNIEECDYSIDSENESDHRLYFGFQISKNDKEEDNLESIERQSIPKIYGIMPELWTDEELNNWSVKLKQYSKKFIKSVLDEDGIVHKNPSLKDAREKNSMIVFEPYTDKEKQIHMFTQL